MIYSKSTICKELCFEYGIKRKDALYIIDIYKKRGEYSLLCALIEIRNSIPVKEVLLNEPI